MPIYEFRCNDTGNHFEVEFETIFDYESAEIVSPYTQSTNVSRIIREVNISGKALNFEKLMNSDEDALEALENADPQTLGRSLQAMAAETGEDMGTEFNDIVDRMAAGQSPQEIEDAVTPPDSTDSDD